MELENHTQLEAALLRGALPGEERTLAVVVAKASGVIDARGRMQLDLGLRTPVCHESVPHPDGQIPGDLAPRKRGFEVLALGQAYHPEVDGGSESEVVVSVREERRTLRVFGERRWYRAHGGDWRISPPEPFSMQSLSFRNAFGGGSFDVEGNECPHPLNAEGKGYIACEEAVEGTLLPNLEDPEQLIRSWQDQPRPCSVAPASRQLSVDVERVGAEMQAAMAQGRTFQAPSELWNDAVPRFRFGEAAPGTPVMLQGMSEQPLRGTLPGFRLWADATAAQCTVRLPLALDTLLWLPEQRRALFTYRASFTYRFVPRDTRCVRLTLEG